MTAPTRAVHNDFMISISLLYIPHNSPRAAAGVEAFLVLFLLFLLFVNAVICYLF